MPHTQENNIKSYKNVQKEKNKIYTMLKDEQIKTYIRESEESRKGEDKKDVKK